MIVAAMAILLSLGQALAQTPDPQPPGRPSDPARPPLNPFPAEQDWSFLSRPALHPDFFDPAKYICLGGGPQRYISFGLEYRTEYEYYDNWMFGAGTQDHNGYVLSRVMPHFDLHAGSDFRLFSEFQFDSVAGRTGGPRKGVDEDPGNVHQAFLEIGPHVSREHGSSLRLGRQEVVLGSGRLFDNNEGPNVKLSFDGVRWITQTSKLRWDVIALKPVEDNHDFFDDAPNSQQTTWGSYLTLPAPILSRGMADLYYLGLATKTASYNRGVRDRASPHCRHKSLPATIKGPRLQLGSQLSVGIVWPRFDCRVERFPRRRDTRLTRFDFILARCCEPMCTAVTGTLWEATWARLTPISLAAPTSRPKSLRSLARKI
jgi:hypothetical protein